MTPAGRARNPLCASQWRGLGSGEFFWRAGWTYLCGVLGRTGSACRAVISLWIRLPGVRRRPALTVILRLFTDKRRRGNSPARFARAYRIQRRSLAMPGRCCAAQVQQLRIRQRRLAAGQVIPRPAQQGQHMVVEIHVECGQEGVQVVRHKTIFDVLAMLTGQRHAPRSNRTHSSRLWSAAELEGGVVKQRTGAGGEPGVLRAGLSDDLAAWP